PERIARLEFSGTEAFDAVAFGREGEVVGGSHEKLSTVWTINGRQDGRTGLTNAERVVLSPDGQFFAAIQPDNRLGVVEVRAIRTHELLAAFDEKRKITGLALSPGGKHVLISTEESSDNSRTSDAEVWELPGPKQIARLPYIESPSFSPDGAYIT